MRLSALLASLTLATLLFAGCSGDGGEGDGTTTSTSASGTSSATGSSTSRSATGTTTPAPANQPPTGSLTTSVPGGAAPLNVTFTVEGGDPDGDDLEWTLSFGDGMANDTGTELPAEATHSYATAGSFNVTFTLDDGLNATAYHALVNVSAEATAAAAVILTGHVTAPSPSYNTEGECLEAILVDDFGSIFAVPKATWGWTYAFDVAGMTAIFYTEGLAENLQEGPSGEVPEGAVEVIACSELAIDTDYALTFTPP